MATKRVIQMSASTLTDLYMRLSEYPQLPKVNINISRSLLRKKPYQTKSS